MPSLHLIGKGKVINHHMYVPFKALKKHSFGEGRDNLLSVLIAIKFIHNSYLLEGNIAQVIQKIRNKQYLLETDRQILSGFIAFQFVRTDSYIESKKDSTEFFMKHHMQYTYRTFEQFNQIVPEIEKDIGKSLGDPRELYDFMVSGKYTAHISKEDAMKEAIHMGNTIWEDFLNADYEVLETNKSNFFLISDNPFFIIPPKNHSKGDGIGLFTPYGEKIIPINSRQCLRINLIHRENSGVNILYRTINHKETDRINSYICKNASRFVMSRNKEYLQKLIKTIDFKKAQEEKTHKKLEYNNDIQAIIGRQLYPL